MTAQNNSFINPSTAWGTALEAAVCERCDHRFLIPAGNHPVICPSCFRGMLTRQPETEINVQPELVLPFRVQEQTILQAFSRFTADLWFAPEDLTPVNLRGRLQRVYQPVWLVDGKIHSLWQAEAGYNYEVVSHQNRYEDYGGGWTEKKVKENRVRWEPRVGRLQRVYQNIAAPALEQPHALFQKVGQYPYNAAQQYTVQALTGSSESGAVSQPVVVSMPWAVSLPEREPQDAWPDALPVFQAAAAEDCRQACAADHLREFKWQPEFQAKNWTLLLLPLLTSYYVDDEKNPQVVLMHGQTGKLFGVRRASKQSAQKTAVWLGVFSVLLFVLSLAGSAFSLLAPILLPLVAIGWLMAIGLGVGAVVPFLMVWWTNSR